MSKDRLLLNIGRGKKIEQNLGGKKLALFASCFSHGVAGICGPF